MRVFFTFRASAAVCWRGVFLNPHPCGCKGKNISPGDHFFRPGAAAKNGDPYHARIDPDSGPTHQTLRRSNQSIHATTGLPATPCMPNASLWGNRSPITAAGMMDQINTWGAPIAFTQPGMHDHFSAVHRSPSQFHTQISKYLDWD